MATLSAVSDQLTLAREYAMLGDYDTSLVYFDGVLSLLSKCAPLPSAPGGRTQSVREGCGSKLPASMVMHSGPARNFLHRCPSRRVCRTRETLTRVRGYYCRHVRTVDDPMLKGKWLKVRRELTEEMGLVRSLEGEKRALVGAPAVPSLRSSQGAHDDVDGAAGRSDAEKEAGGPPLLLPTHHVSYSRREAAHLQRAYGGGRDDPPAVVDPGGTDDDPAVWRPPSRGPLPPPSRPRPSHSSGRHRDDAAAAATPTWARRRSVGDASDSPSTTAPSRAAALAARGGRGAAAPPRSATGAAAAGRMSPNNGRTSPTVSRTNSRRVAPDVKEVLAPSPRPAEISPFSDPPGPRRRSSPTTWAGVPQRHIFNRRSLTVDMTRGMLRRALQAKATTGHVPSQWEGPDQDLYAQLERDVLDNSPGVRWGTRLLDALSGVVFRLSPMTASRSHQLDAAPHFSHSHNPTRQSSHLHALPRPLISRNREMVRRSDQPAVSRVGRLPAGGTTWQD